MTVRLSDIEAKAQELRDTIQETKETVRSRAVVVGAVGFVVIGFAFYLGKRRARRGTFVEVYRS